MHDNRYDFVVIGGGAAGYFASIIYSENNPKGKVLLLEKSLRPLAKVKISGGGRCNTTHFCFDPNELIKNYPRGSKELLAPFMRFNPANTIEWFKDRGVELKREPDGRMFPVTDDSQTIINCLQKAASGVEIQCGKSVEEISRSNEGFVLRLKNGEEILANAILLATGGSPAGHALAKGLGHTIMETAPSLFTFNIPGSPLHSLSGVSVENAKVSLPDFRSKQTGPLLITHWGFSGPAVLKLSAFCARELQRAEYQTSLLIDWSPKISLETMKEAVSKRKNEHPAKLVINDPLFSIPRQLWRALAIESGLTDEVRWTNLSNAQREKLILQIKLNKYEISGKTTYKEEFVTCGGVKLSEVNFQRMESKLVPGLFFAGEILDIDGITGGFNFQAAWTTGWIAGHAASGSPKSR